MTLFNKTCRRKGSLPEIALFYSEAFLKCLPQYLTQLCLASHWLCWGLTTRQPLRVILCRLPEEGRKEIEERVEEMKERDREERGTGMKVKKQKK